MQHAPIETIALCVPAAIRGQRGRPLPPPEPLLPVFIAGEENRFVAFVCNAAADQADGNDTAGGASSTWGAIGVGPLLLIGPSGCGKTALATHLTARRLEQLGESGSSAASMPGVDFARYYARSVDSDEIGRFRREIDSVPVLMIDDVHLMAGKPAAQEELASRLETRCDEGRPTILTCRRLPTQSAGLRPLLVSRMLPGLTVPIRLPGPETRRALLIEFARRRQMVLGEDEIELLVRGLDAELPARRLDAVIAHLELHCRMNACSPDVHAVREAILASEPASDLSADRIAKLISRRYRVRLAELKSGTRRQEVVRARSLAMYLTRRLTGSSYHRIGKYFGGRDHTTVLHACRKTESMMEEDADLRVTADELTEQLKSPA